MSPQDSSNIRRTAQNDIYVALLVVAAVLITVALTLSSIEIYSMYYAAPSEVTVAPVEASPATEQAETPAQAPEGQGAAQPAGATEQSKGEGAGANP